MSACRGALIVFEGCDCVGKTTQIKKLYESLKLFNKNVQIYKFPNRTTSIGKLINEYLRNKQKLDDHVIHLLFSANRWECIETLKKDIYSGNIVLVDRYVYSGIAYSAAKENISFDWCKKSDEGLPKPDLVIYLESSNENNILSREDFGDEIYENKLFLQKVKKIYDKLKDNNWKTFNYQLGIEETHKRILKEVENLLEKDLKSNLMKLFDS